MAFSAAETDWGLRICLSDATQCAMAKKQDRMILGSHEGCLYWGVETEIYIPVIRQSSMNGIHKLAQAIHSSPLEYTQSLDSAPVLTTPVRKLVRSCHTLWRAFTSRMSRTAAGNPTTIYSSHPAHCHTIHSSNSISRKYCPYKSGHSHLLHTVRWY